MVQDPLLAEDDARTIAARFFSEYAGVRSTPHVRTQRIMLYLNNNHLLQHTPAGLMTPLVVNGHSYLNLDHLGYVIRIFETLPPALALSCSRPICHLY